MKLARAVAAALFVAGSTCALAQTSSQSVDPRVPQKNPSGLHAASTPSERNDACTAAERNYASGQRRNGFQTDGPALGERPSRFRQRQEHDGPQEAGQAGQDRRQLMQQRALARSAPVEGSDLEPSFFDDAGRSIQLLCRRPQQIPASALRPPWRRRFPSAVAAASNRSGPLGRGAAIRAGRSRRLYSSCECAG